jgi:hypothetical protein
MNFAVYLRNDIFQNNIQRNFILFLFLHLQKIIIKIDWGKNIYESYINLDDEKIIKTVRRLLIIYKNKLRILLRKRFANWKLKTYTVPHTKNAENQMVYKHESKQAKENLEFNKEFKIKNENDFIDSKKNINEKENDFAYKNYNHPFTPVAHSNMKQPKNSIFSREELNGEFENKNKESNVKDHLTNENKNITYSANKSNKNIAKNEHQDEYANKFYSSAKKENGTISKIKYNSNYDVNDNDYGHSNTTRNKETSANKVNKTSRNNQYSSLFCKNSNKNESNEKIRSPQKIYDKLHQVC